MVDARRIQHRRRAPLLVMHGDEFDTVMLAHRWLAFSATRFTASDGAEQRTSSAGGQLGYGIGRSADG